MKPLQTGATAPTNYSAADVARWRGPYLTKDSSTAANTGFGWVIQEAFVTDSFANTGSFGAQAASPNRFLTLRVCQSLSGTSCPYGAATSLDSASWKLFERQFDDTIALSGSVRFRSDSGFIKVLSMPIQP